MCQDNVKPASLRLQDDTNTTISMQTRKIPSLIAHAWTAVHHMKMTQTNNVGALETIEIAMHKCADGLAMSDARCMISVMSLAKEPYKTTLLRAK